MAVAQAVHIKEKDPLMSHLGIAFGWLTALQMASFDHEHIVSLTPEFF